MGRFARNPLGQQHALDRVQAVVMPRIEVLAQIFLQQPAVEERLVLLVGEVRLDHVAEERRVLFRQEEVQLVAGVFGVEGTLFLRLLLRPVEDEGKLGQLRIA